MTKNISAKVLISLFLFVMLVAVPDNRAYAASTTQYEPETLEEMIAYLFGIITQLQAQLDAQNGGTGTGTTNPSHNNSGRVTVTTLAPTNISRSEATLKGEASSRAMGGDVWFEYGLKSDLDDDTDKKTFKANHQLTFSATIEGLRSNTKYSYRAVLREDDGDYTYGQIKSFTTDSSGSSNSSNANNSDDEPNVETNDVEDISDDRATIFGYIDMEDYDAGVAFFVYGRDEDLVGGVENDYDEYSDIYAPVTGFGKVLVEQDFTGSDEISYDLDGLVENSTYYYRACVEYDEDNNDYVIICGDTEDFESDNY
jgi:hypothetical protein